MAIGNFMMQFEVTQSLAGYVNDVEPLDAEVFEFLSGGDLTVREIAAEKYGGIIANNVDAFAFLSLTPFVKLVLVFANPKQDEVAFYGPSFVASPPVHGAGLAILKVADPGLGPASGNILSVFRTIGRHAYAEET